MEKNKLTEIRFFFQIKKKCADFKTKKKEISFLFFFDDNKFDILKVKLNVNVDFYLFFFISLFKKRRLIDYYL